MPSFFSRLRRVFSLSLLMVATGLMILIGMTAIAQPSYATGSDSRAPISGVNHEGIVSDYGNQQAPEGPRSKSNESSYEAENPDAAREKANRDRAVQTESAQQSDSAAEKAIKETADALNNAVNR